MENSKISEKMSELLDLLCDLRKEKGDADVAFAISLMVLENEEAQNKVVDYIKANKDNTSLEDVCRFLNTMFEPLETSDDEDDIDEVPA